MRAFARKEIDDPGRVTVGGFDSRPGPTFGDHGRGIDIRVGAHAARCADKRLSISEAPFKADAARLGRIRRAHEDQPDPLRGRLVPHEFLELRERPEGDHAVQVPVWHSHAISDSPEILHGDPVASRAEGFRDDLLREPMIFRGHAPGVESREPFQGALGAFRALGLKTGADLPPDLAVLTSRGSFVLLSRRESGDVADPQIDAQDAARGGFLDGALDHDVRVESVLGLDERRRLSELGAPEGFVLVDTDIETRRDAFTRMRRERNDALGQLKRERAGIKSDERGTVLELSPASGGLEAAGDAAAGGNRQIGRKAVFGADVSIKCLLQIVGIGFPMVTSIGTDLGASLGVKAEKLVDDGKVFGMDDDLAPNGADGLHGYILGIMLH